MVNMRKILILLPFLLMSTTLYRPASVVYDSKNNVYYISTLGKKDGVSYSGLVKSYSFDKYSKGFIYQYNPNDSITKPIVNGDEDNKRMYVVGNKLYVCGVDKVLEYKIGEGLLKEYHTKAKGKRTRRNKSVDSPLKAFAISNNNKFIILTDKGEIQEFNTASDRFKVMNNINGRIDKANDMYLIRNERKLIVTSLNPHSPIQSVDLNTGEVAPIELGIDEAIYGISQYQDRQFFLSGWDTGKIYLADLNTLSYQVIDSSQSKPAYLYYNEIRQELAIPNMYAGVVNFISY